MDANLGCYYFNKNKVVRAAPIAFLSKKNLFKGLLIEQFCFKREIK
jgi:hypothetical protein